MIFTGEKAAFGRHETFPPRYGWLTKGIQALIGGGPVFEAEDATVKLGVGKNMVSAIRYWLQATRLIEKREDGWELTDAGIYVFDDQGYDRYLEDEGTIWLLHWLIATNPDLATAFWWFFNRFQKPEFTASEVVNALQDFARAELKTRHAAGTLKGDVAVLTRMYVRSAPSSKVAAEDALDSPLSLLGLVTNHSAARTFESRPTARSSLPPAIVGYAVVELLGAMQTRQLPIEELMYGRVAYPALGSVFRLSETDLIRKLEQLVDILPDIFSLRETAGVHQLYLLEDVLPRELLAVYYADATQEAAA